MQYFVYILRLSNNHLYIGCTNNLQDRLRRHKRGEVAATENHLPFRLALYCCFSDKYLAYKFEKYLKSGSGRAFTNKHFV